MRSAFRLFAAPAFFLLLFTFPVFGAEGVPSQTQRAVASLRSELPALRISTADCSIPPRWELAHTIPAVEALPMIPLEAPLRVSSWSAAALSAQRPSDLYALAAGFLASGKDVAVSSGSDSFVKEAPGLPAEMLASTGRILDAMRQAQSLLKKSYAGLTGQERAQVLEVLGFPASKPLLSVRAREAAFESLKKFDQDSLLAAGSLVVRAVDREMEDWKRWAADPKADFGLARFKTDLGDVILSGKSDDAYSEETLKNVALVIDLGGDNRYAGPLAGAREGEIKVAIDLGRNVTVTSTGSAVSAGAGVFGIGLLYLPDAGGTKTVATGSFAQGSALCGVGGLFVNGPGSFTGDAQVQGAAAFGIGLFSAEAGEGSRYESNHFSQGAGLTRGVGIFRHAGSRAVFRAGLTEPDPREPLGATSLCQGVGYGPRAFAGGGLGICALRGDEMNLESSYFAQGAGYWHAAGAFLIEGNSNEVKARRYDQGSGIHSAAGFFFLNGHENHAVNWGVGPAFGWDQGLGWAQFFGDRNLVQTEWGAGGSANNYSRSFSVFSGARNVLDLPGLAGGGLNRDLPDYALSVVEGEGTRFRLASLKKEVPAQGRTLFSPWSLLRFSGVHLTQESGLPKPVWSDLARRSPEEQPSPDLAQEIDAAAQRSGQEKTERLIQAASLFTGAPSETRRALGKLAEAADLESLTRALDPADFDGFVHLRAVAALYGDRIAAPATAEAARERDPQRRATLLSLLEFARLREALPVLLAACDDPDWRLRVSGLRLLGRLLDRDRGPLPGRAALLQSLSDWLDSRFTYRWSERRIIKELRAVPFVDAAALMALSQRWPLERRREILDRAPADIMVSLDEGPARQLLSELRRKRRQSLEAFRAELGDCAGAEDAARAKALAILNRENAHPGTVRRELLQAALALLGKIGRAEDAGPAARLLNHDSAWVRDAAAVALGRLGGASLPWLEKAWASPDAAARAQTLVALSKTSDPALAPILEKGLRDPDPLVRQTAFAVLEQLQPALAKVQKRLRRKFPPRGLAAPQRAFLYGR